MMMKFFTVILAAMLAGPAYGQGWSGGGGGGGGGVGGSGTAGQIATWATTSTLGGLTPGTGITTALGTNVGTAGAPVINGGALGTPSSGTLTNVTGLPVAGITGLGTNVPALLAAPAAGTAFGSYAFVSPGPLTNSSGNVALNNTSTFFDGPAVAQGSTGTWYAAGAVTVTDTAVANIFCQLWDGTTTIDSAGVTISAANVAQTLALSGFKAAPAGNLRISCKDVTTVNGSILGNASGLGKDSTITVFRLN